MSDDLSAVIVVGEESGVLLRAESLNAVEQEIATLAADRPGESLGIYRLVSYRLGKRPTKCPLCGSLNAPALLVAEPEFITCSDPWHLAVQRA